MLPKWAKSSVQIDTESDHESDVCFVIGSGCDVGGFSGQTCSVTNRYSTRLDFCSTWKPFGDEFRRNLDAESHRNRDGKQIGVKKDAEDLAAVDFGGSIYCISVMREAGPSAICRP